MSLGYTSGGFRFPFRTVKVFTLWDNMKWALRWPGLSSGLAGYPPQYQKGIWLLAKSPFFAKTGRPAKIWLPDFRLSFYSSSSIRIVTIGPVGDQGEGNINIGVSQKPSSNIRVEEYVGYPIPI